MTTAQLPTLEPLFDDDRPDPTTPLVATGNLRRRMFLDRFVQSTATLAAVLALAVLAWMVYTVISNGASSISWEFLTGTQSVNGFGIGPAILGSAIMVSFATVLAVPVAILIAVYLNEYSTGGRFASLVRLCLDTIQGVPSIIIGVFVFGLMEAGGGGQTGLALSVALAIIMVPLIARSSQEVMLLVPRGMLDAADALGVARWRKIIGVLLPSSIGGILTGSVLAVARAAGETAPVIILLGLVTSTSYEWNLFSVPISTIPLVIYSSSNAGNLGNAWGAALVLLTIILTLNIASRWWFTRSQKKKGLPT
jgi:phosphate transport system permease protein